MAILACQLIGTLILGAAGVLDDISNGIVTAKGETLKTALSLIYQLAYAAVFFGFIFIKKTKPDIFLRPESPAKSVKLIWGCLAGVVFGIISIVCFAAVSEAGQQILDAIGYKLADKYTKGIALQDVFLLVTTILFAPVCEELIYRSALSSGLKKIFNNYVTALLAGLAFAFMHMNPEQTIYQFFLGFGATLLALSCGNVIPAMIMHMVSNVIAALNMTGVSFINRFFNGYGAVFASSPGWLAASSVLLGGAGVAAFIFGTRFLKTYAVQNDNAGVDSVLDSGLNAESDAGLAVNSDINTAKPVKAEKKNEDAFASRENQNFFIQHRTVLMYACGLGISVFMWITVFIDRLVV